MQATLQGVISQIGGRVVNEFDDGTRITHIVTGIVDQEQRTQRTIKYCCGVLTGAWVVTFEWVLASLSAREWVEELDYEVRGDTHALGAPKKARLALRKSGSTRLFAGLRFCFGGEFALPSRADLEGIARTGGAEILSSLPTPTTNMQEYLAEVQHTYVICDREITDEAGAGEMHMVCGLVPISYHWLLDSVSNYSLLQVDSYRILPRERGRGFETQQSLEF